MRYLMKLEHPTIYGGNYSGSHTRVMQTIDDGFVRTCREDGTLSSSGSSDFDIINVPDPALSADELLVKARDLAKMMVRGGLGSWGSEQYSQTLVDQIDAYFSAKDAKP